ncbi:MAG: HupE/UreJ family protein [Bacteroidota bacterium]
MFWSFLKIGFEHVVPFGYDHILFIVALFFFNSKLKSAIIQCSIFTLAHSLTLALVALGYINVNSKFVEVVIALSIFIVAFENIFQPTLKPWRLGLIFIFGLIHGMGFASALRDFGLPKNEMIISLVGFNVGVEIAQIAIILFCYFAVSKWIIEKDWYQKKLVNPLSMVISAIALFLAINRYLSN